MIFFSIFFVSFMIYLFVSSMKEERRYKQKFVREEAERKRLEEKEQKEKKFFDEINEMRSKWKQHPMYQEIIKTCKSEVLQFYDDIIQGKSKKYTTTYINHQYCYGLRYEVVGWGIICSGEDIKYESLGYRGLSSLQYLSLGLAIGDALEKEFESFLDLTIEARINDSLEDGSSTTISIGLPEENYNPLKKVVL